MNTKKAYNIGAIYDRAARTFCVLFTDGQVRTVIANNAEHARSLAVMLRKSQKPGYYQVASVQGEPE